jgi:hypothetical protein
MKNIHVLTTDKPSRFFNTNTGEYHFREHYVPDTVQTCKNHNIYITNNKEIKEGDWYLNTEEKNGIMNPFYGKLYKSNKSINKVSSDYIHNLKKIILTTDEELITEGVQPIDEEFLEWFVKNPSCEEVNVEDYGNLYNFRYLILIPKEEPKEETIITAAQSYAVNKKNRTSHYMGFIEGAKWQQERMYCEEEVLELLHKRMTHTLGEEYKEETTLEWFEQFKKSEE